MSAPSNILIVAFRNDRYNDIRNLHRQLSGNKTIFCRFYINPVLNLNLAKYAFVFTHLFAMLKAAVNSKVLVFEGAMLLLVGRLYASSVGA